MDNNEDLYNNVFLKTLKTKFPKIYQLIETNCYMFCIPHSMSLYGMNLTQKIIESHILIGSKFYQDEYESYGSGATYTIENSLIIDKSDHTKKIKILFDEICYNKDYKPYRFFCIEYPLVGGTGIKPSISQDGDDFGISKPQKPTFEHSITLLLSSLNSPNSIVIRKLDAEIEDILANFKLDKSTEPLLREQLHRLRERYLDDLVCANAEYKLLQSNERQMNNLSMHLESYMFGKLHQFIYGGLKEIYKEKNTYYYEKMMKLNHLSLEDCGVNNAFKAHLLRATDAMNQFQHDVTPIDKLLTIIQTSSEIENSIKTSSLLELNDQTLTITGDEAFPLISYLLIQTHPRNLESDLAYCTNYILTNISTTSLEYNLVNFQASIEHIKQLIEANQSKIQKEEDEKNSDNEIEQQINNNNNHHSNHNNNSSYHTPTRKSTLNLPTYLSSNSLLASYTSPNSSLYDSQDRSTYYTTPMTNNASITSPSSSSSSSITSSTSMSSMNRYLTTGNHQETQSTTQSKYNASNPFPYHKYTKPPSVISLDDDEGDPW